MRLGHKYFEYPRDRSSAHSSVGRGHGDDINEQFTLMPRSHIHGSPRRFYYGLDFTDDPGNANFRSPIRMHYIRMIKYYYV